MRERVMVRDLEFAGHYTRTLVRFLQEERGRNGDETNHEGKSLGNSNGHITVRTILRAARVNTSLSRSGSASRTQAGRRRRRDAAAAAVATTRQTRGRAGGQGRKTGGRSRLRNAFLEDRAFTPRDLGTVRLSGLSRRGAVSVFISNGEPGRPVFLSRRRGGELVEIDGRVGKNLRAWVRKQDFLGGINRSDHLEGNHIQVVPSHELNLHVRPFSSGVDLPYNYALSPLFERITRTRDTRLRVGPG